MPWKNSSVIKNSFFSKCLLATLYISAQINKHRLFVTVQRIGKCFCGLFGPQLPQQFTQETCLSPSERFRPPEEQFRKAGQRNSGIQVSLAGVLSAPDFLLRGYHWNPHADVNFLGITMAFVLTYQPAQPGLSSPRKQGCVSNMLKFTKTTWDFRKLGSAKSTAFES